MRWWSIPILIALSWFAFTLTPLWALYDLARAVQGGDAGYVENHVNFRTLRFSLTRQLVAAIKIGTLDMEPRERERVVDASTALALPIAESLVTPQTVIDLLNDGWPQSLDLANPAPTSAPGGLHAEKLGELGKFYAASEMRGFRTVVIAVPPNRAGPDRFKIRMRLRGLSWRLVEIELSEALRTRMAEKVARIAKRGEQWGDGQKGDAPGLRSGTGP